VGTTAEIQNLRGNQTEVVDLAGRFVAPGFGDAHFHTMMGSLALEELDLVGTRDAAEVQQRLAAYARAQPERPWIVGRGWAYGELGGPPHRRILDAAVPDRPVFLGDRDGHSSWANSKALALAGITRTSKDPASGIIVRDEGGEPTGLLKEAAGELVGRVVPPPSADEKYRALVKGVALAASYGLTSVQDAGFDEGNLPVFERLLDEGGLKVRMRSALPMVKDPTGELLARYRGLREKYASNRRFRFGALKSMVDGVVDAKTAVMLEPYTSGGTGLPNWSPEDLNRTVALYDKEGFQVWLHACGDRAVRMALDAYEGAALRNGTKDRRHRVEHAEVVSDADRPRFHALGVIASTQALFANPDKTTLENYAVLLGPARASRANAFKRFDDAGAVQAFGSDWPVFSCEVLRGIYCAATRVTPEGTPAGGWYPENRISAEAALRHFTQDAAYAGFDEGVRGMLTPGRLADFVVLSEDILAGPPERILRAKVLLTVMGGRDTFRAPEF
jgi:hypothetical protein